MDFIIPPWVKYATIIGVAFLLVGGIYWAGYHEGKSDIIAEYNEKAAKILEKDIALNGERVELSTRLAKESTAREENIRVIKEKIPVYVADNRSCDLPIELIKLLRSARSGELPKPTE